MTTRISFSLSSEKAGHATTGMVLGDFNNWNPEEGIYLQKQDDGSLVAEMYLTPGQSYQYRYLLSDGRWVNDDNPRVVNELFGYPVENCLITVPEPVSKTKLQRTVKKATSVPKKAVKSSQKDDLLQIEGIGKKINVLLQKQGILTYQDLGKCSIKKLKEILATAGNKMNMHDPSSWPKQAKLAAAGKWDELKALQDTLTAGR